MYLSIILTISILKMMYKDISAHRFFCGIHFPYVISKRMAANRVLGSKGSTAKHDEDENEVGKNVVVD